MTDTKKKTVKKEQPVVKAAAPKQSPRNKHRGRTT